MTPALKSRRGWIAGFCVAWMASPGYPANATDNTLPPELGERDRRMIESALGQTVLGRAISAPALADPVGFFAPVPGPRIYRLLNGERHGLDEPHRFITQEGQGGGRVWEYRIADGEALLFAEQTDGSIVLTGVNDFKEGVSIHYNPPKPFLTQGMAAGDERKFTVQAQIFKLKEPGHLVHSGRLDGISVSLGTYQITVPAGQFDAMLIKSTTHGSIGPAKIDNTQYHFFALHDGIVASLEQREVNALGVYHATVKAPRVLIAKPE
ncbi:MAG: hypothetical protein WC856_02810 [Methylococcaceae bacterium]